MHGFQRCMLGQRVQQRHQRVPLLAPSRALMDPVDGPNVILPKVCGRLRMEEPRKWGRSTPSRHLLQPVQHRTPRNNVVRTDPICGRDGRILIHVSQPARVDSVYWNGAVAATIAGPNCRALARSVNLRITSPATIPRTHHPSCAMRSSNPPCSLHNAVIQPSFTIYTTLCGSKPREKDSATRNNVCRSRGLSNNWRRWSHVIPEGPPATPRLADLTFQPKSLSSRLKVETPVGRSSTGSLGTSCLRNCVNVAEVAGANQTRALPTAQIARPSTRASRHHCCPHAVDDVEMLWRLLQHTRRWPQSNRSTGPWRTCQTC